MTPIQALKGIIKDKKWYVVWSKDNEGFLKRNTKKETYLRITALRILNGTAQPSSMSKFFAHFGMEVEVNVKRNEPI